MKNRFFFGAVLLILFTTFISQKKISINQFKVNEIIFENNEIISDQELREDLSFLYQKNMVFLNSFEIRKKIEKNSFVKRLEIKKIYPSKLIIRVFEKEPIAILFNRQKKFFIGKNLDLIEYRKISRYKNLSIIYGDYESFKILFSNLKKVKFPISSIKKYNFFKSDRWDLILNDQRVIKLPSQNYNQNLKNFIKIRTNRNFDKYKLFDYRLSNQLILN